LLALDNGQTCIQGLPSLVAGPAQIADWHHGGWHPVLCPLDGLANDPERLLIP